MTKEPHLPVEPLVPYIRHREKLAGGRVELARKHHRQLGVSEAGAARMFDCRFKTITLKQADRICLALGLHINLVYGREVYEQGLEEVGEEAVTAMS